MKKYHEKEARDKKLGYCTKCDKKSTNVKAKYCIFCGSKLVFDGDKIRSKRGEGNVEPLPSGRFRARINGVDLHTYDTEEEALLAIAQYKVLNPDLASDDVSKYTLDDIYQQVMYDFAKRLERGKISKSHYKNMENAYKYFDEKDKKLQINKVKRITFEHAYENAMDEGRTKDTFKKIRTLINAICDRARAIGVENFNYDRDLKIPKDVEPSVNDIRKFSKKEMDILYANAENDDNVKTILIMCYTGMRPGELLALEKKNVHLEKKYIIGGFKTKAGKDRFIPIADIIYPYVEYFYNRNESYLIQTKPGKATNPVQRNNWEKRNFNPTLEKLNIDKNYKGRITPSSCRKTCASLLRAMGVDNGIIIRFLGHTKISTTETYYMQVEEEDISTAISALKLPSQVNSYLDI